MSIVLMVNEKWRERVPLWSAFQEEPNSFPNFFHCLLEACLSNIEVQYCFQWVMSSLCHTLGRQAEHAWKVHTDHFLGSCLQQLGNTILCCLGDTPSIITLLPHRRLIWFESKFSVLCRYRSGSILFPLASRMSLVLSQNSGSTGTSFRNEINRLTQIRWKSEWRYFKLSYTFIDLPAYIYYVIDWNWSVDFFGIWWNSFSLFWAQSQPRVSWSTSSTRLS